MSFERGRTGFRIFRWRGELPSDWVERVRCHTCPPLSAIGTEPVQGWTGGRHALDLPVTPNCLTYGGWIRMLFVRAVRRAPSAYLTALLQAEELSLLATSNRPFLDLQARTKLHQEIIERVSRESPPMLNVIQLVADPAEGIAYASAMSDRHSELLAVWWQRTFGRRLDVLDPVEAVTELRAPHPRDWPPFYTRRQGETDPGCEFLTWLWFALDVGENDVEIPRLGRAGYILEGPLVFGIEQGEGALEAVVRRGQPLNGIEARAALRAGKLLRRASIRLVCGPRKWSCAVEGRLFAFRSFQPTDDPELCDPVSRFQDRVHQLHEFRRVWLALYHKFVATRTNGSEWQRVQHAMERWIASD